jgi:hypothetical protein
MIAIGILMEYNRIDGEILYIKNKFFSKEKIVKISEIQKIIRTNSLKIGTFVYNIVLRENINIEIRAEIENGKYFFDKLLETNNNIELKNESPFELFDFFGDLFEIVFSLLFYTITFYKIFKMII